MEPTNRHPLECITNQNGLAILECLIPFVDYPLKLPLALFIKFNEIKLITDAFSSYDNICRYGLHQQGQSPYDILASFTGISPEMMKTFMQMSNFTDGTFGRNHIFSPFMDGSYFGTDPPLSDAISSIFTQYDMEQNQYQQEDFHGF